MEKFMKNDHGRLHHTRDSRARVIREFQKTGRIDLATTAAGVDRSCHYRWLRTDKAYAQAFETARKPVGDMLEDEAIRRAVEGVDEPRLIGKEVVMVRTYSDRLLELLLKSRRREVFGDKTAVEISGPDGGPVTTKLALEFVLQAGNANGRTIDGTAEPIRTIEATAQDASD